MEDPAAAGFTEIATSAAGVELAARAADRGLLEIAIGGRALAAGERVDVVYGAGAAGALVDRFAERAAPIHFAVDGDGDGVRSFLAEPPLVDVAAGPAARLVATLPSTARPGDPVVLRVAALDAHANAGAALAGAVALEVEGPLAVPAELALAEGGVAAVEGRATGAGVARVRARGPEGLVAESNPLRVEEGVPRVLWADLHGHSHLSDGTGTPEDYLRYARDVAGLDAVALTDHDHWGTPFLDESPALWSRIVAATAAFHAPGRFVTLLGYEWTSWLHGHRHVLWFADAGRIRSSLDEATDDPAELWASLRGEPALTFAHHSAGGPVATNWDFAPDPVLEPVTEIVSVHGSSEAADAPLSIYAPVPGNYARDALARGYRLGFIGSGDSHDGHPGLAHLASPSGGGLAALYAEERTREGVRAALSARRCYATNGPRILLEAYLGTRPMGAAVPPGDAALRVRVTAPQPLARVELVRGGEVSVLQAFPPEEASREALVGARAEGLRAGEALYVRVVQADDGAAWSSPWFVDAGVRAR